MAREKSVHNIKADHKSGYYLLTPFFTTHPKPHWHNGTMPEQSLTSPFQPEKPSQTLEQKSGFIVEQSKKKLCAQKSSLKTNNREQSLKKPFQPKQLSQSPKQESGFIVEQWFLGIVR